MRRHLKPFAPAPQGGLGRVDTPHNAWVKLNRPEVYRAKPLSAFDQNIIETGNEVDELARGLFPGGALVARNDFERTSQLLAARQPIIYQAAIATDRFVIACDLLVWNSATNSYDLYEVKASTSGDDKKAKEHTMSAGSASVPPSAAYRGR